MADHLLYGPDGHVARRWEIRRFTNARLVRLDAEGNPTGEGVPLPAACMTINKPATDPSPCVPFTQPARFSLTIEFERPLAAAQQRGAVILG